MTRRHAQSTLRWITTIVVILLIGAAAAVGVYQYMRPSVTVTEAVEGPVVQAFYSTGTIEPQREYPIKSNTAGTITQVQVDKGHRVSKGQALAVVTDPALLFTAQKAKAELDEKLHRAEEKTSPVLMEFDARLKGSQELLEIAQREVKRISDLMQSNAGAQTDLDRAMDRVKQLLTDSEAIRAQKSAKKLELEREVEVARSALNIANWNVEQQTLRSPIDGVVLDRPTSLGTRVAINDPLMRIADVAPANLVMRADVDEEDIANVNEGQTVRMTLYSFPGRVLSGRVTKIYDQADEARRTFEVDVKLDDPSDRLQPGMTGELAFVVATRDRALVIPAQALQDGSVYVVRDNQLEKAQVQVGLKSIERIEILSGLAPGATVVITPATAMRIGQVVRSKYMDPVAAAGLNKPPPMVEAFKSFGH
jgi:RND family efflux transporter MFP subunit